MNRLSSDDEAIYKKVLSAFAESERPEQFTCMDGDFECMDAEKLWQARTPESLQFSDIYETLSWPDNELLEEGWLYYFPGFVRVALENAKNTSGDSPPCERLVFYMLWEHCRLHDACSDSQRKIVSKLVDYLLSQHIEPCDYFTTEEREKVSAYWKRPPKNKRSEQGVADQRPAAVESESK